MKTKLFVQTTNKRTFSHLITDTSKINAKVMICILPSIKEMDEVLAILNTTLSNLDPSTFYLLEFNLFLHTNDNTRKISYVDSGIGSIYGDNYMHEAIDYSTETYRYSKLKIHGYSPFASYLLNINESEFEMVDFVLDCYENLVNDTLHFNFSEKEFIEFERPLVLIISKLNL